MAENTVNGKEEKNENFAEAKLSDAADKPKNSDREIHDETIARVVQSLGTDKPKMSADVEKAYEKLTKENPEKALAIWKGNAKPEVERPEFIKEAQAAAGVKDYKVVGDEAIAVGIRKLSQGVPMSENMSKSYEAMTKENPEKALAWWKGNAKPETEPPEFIKEAQKAAGVKDYKVVGDEAIAVGIRKLSEGIPMSRDMSKSYEAMTKENPEKAVAWWKGNAKPDTERPEFIKDALASAGVKDHKVIGDEAIAVGVRNMSNGIKMSEDMRKSYETMTRENPEKALGIWNENAKKDTYRFDFIAAAQAAAARSAQSADKPQSEVESKRENQHDVAEAVEERKVKEATLARSGAQSVAAETPANVTATPVEIDKAQEPAKRADVADDMEDRVKAPVATVETATPKKDEPEAEVKKETASATATSLTSTVPEVKAAAASTVAAPRAMEEEGEEKALNVTRKGAELERGEFILPRRIAQAYTEQDGKFYAKETSRMMFHDQGEKLATSTTDKTAIADMVAYAKAKQWESLKLTGSQEFRREAWLQAESQGIKTQGYTPREKDLIELKTLTMERATNSITPLQDRSKDRAQLEAPVAAPRHDLNKNQAATASAVAQNNTTNIKELQKNPAMERFSMEELSKIAFYRALIVEREKDSAPAVREEAVAKFDTAMRDPAMVKALPDPEIKAEEQAATKEHKRNTSELSL